MKTCVEHSLPIDEQSALYRASADCYHLHKENQTFRDIFRNFSWVCDLHVNPTNYYAAFGASEAVKQQWKFQQESTNQCVFINGKYEENLSNLPDSVMVFSLSDARTMFAHLLQTYGADKYPLACLNAIGSQDLGVVIYIPENTRLEEPLYIQHLAYSDTEGQYIYSPKVVLVLGEKACAHVHSEYIACDQKGHSIINGVTEAFVSKEAELLMSVTPNSTHRDCLSWSHIVRIEDSGTCILVQTIGERFHGKGWFENEFSLIGRGARAEALASVKSSTQVWVRNKMIHDAEESYSQQVVKSIVHTGSFAFEGSIVITPQGQLSQAYQKHDTLLLNEQGQVTTFPRLEILVDDVKASHGASVGNIDPRHIFYLKSRGMSHEDAVNKLIQGFLTITLDDEVLCQLAPKQKIFGEDL